MWLTAAISKRKVLSSHWSFPNFFSLLSSPYLLSCSLITKTYKTIWTFVLWFIHLCVSTLQLFVGLSFPYEGPAPLEAIANGCAFLNPKFNPPKSSKNTDFFKGKPTLREVSGADITITLGSSGPGNTYSVPNLPWVAALAQIMPHLSAADLSASLRRGVHRSTTRVDSGHWEHCRGGEGHSLYSQPEG